MWARVYNRRIHQTIFRVQCQQDFRRDSKNHCAFSVQKAQYNQHVLAIDAYQTASEIARFLWGLPPPWRATQHWIDGTGTLGFRLSCLKFVRAIFGMSNQKERFHRALWRQPKPKKRNHKSPGAAQPQPRNDFRPASVLSMPSVPSTRDRKNALTKPGHSAMRMPLF